MQVSEESNRALHDRMRHEWDSLLSQCVHRLTVSKGAASCNARNLVSKKITSGASKVLTPKIANDMNLTLYRSDLL